jgi:hypothetical protein
VAAIPGRNWLREVGTAVSTDWLRTAVSMP